MEPPVGGIAADPVDVRDRTYEPTLAQLTTFRLPPDELIAALRKGDPAVCMPRTQGPEGTCGGQALAVLIDIQRIGAVGDERYPASARMLYECARLTTGIRADAEDRAAGRAQAAREERQADDVDGISLRDVIKAFYNYGVCSETVWAYKPNAPDGQLSVERAKQAKQISLGAYYRLRPNLNTYHAALHETGAILVSAELHDGWTPEQVSANRGEIVPPRPGQSRGALDDEKHAFVIVGYTPKGFLVLNSWGSDWGGWRPDLPGRDDRDKPIPGIALWPYADWADRIMDGWVLRLGVGAAEAFEYSIGDQGLGFGSGTGVRATPVHTILGNFLHLDDGDFVRAGGYVSTELTLTETKRFLAENAKAKADKRYRGVLLTFAGGLVGLRGATDHIARQKRLVAGARWYPFTVLWCVDYVEQSRTILESVFAEAGKRAGGPSARLDRVIEDLAHGVGRAIWRDIECAAAKGARSEGPLHALTRAGAELATDRPEFRLRIVAESEGALALAALLAALRTEGFASEAAAFFAILESVDLIAPPLSLGEHRKLVSDLNAGWGPERADRRLRVHLPCARDEKRLAVPPYGLSYFELVSRAFRGERVRDRPAPPAAQPVRSGQIAAKWDEWRTAANVDLVPIGWGPRGPGHGQGPLDQIQLVYQSDVAGRLRTILRPRSGPGFRAPKSS